MLAPNKAKNKIYRKIITAKSIKVAFAQFDLVAGVLLLNDQINNIIMPTSGIAATIKVISQSPTDIFSSL
jgi:hypothetical protein